MEKLPYIVVMSRKKVSSLKKRLHLFMTLLLAVFLVVILMSFAYSQNNTNFANKIDEVPVVIDGNTLFYILDMFSPV